MSAQFARESAMLKLSEERRRWSESIFQCHKIKDGGYNNITNTNEVSPTQNTPALEANKNSCQSELVLIVVFTLGGLTVK